MKKLITQLVVSGVLLPSTVFAMNLSCSNADQSLRFHHFRSTGGAHLDRKDLTFKGKSVSDFSPQDNLLDYTLTKKVKLKEVKKGEDHVITDFVGEMSVKFEADGETVSFNKILVICREEITPICHLCP